MNTEHQSIATPAQCEKCGVQRHSLTHATISSVCPDCGGDMKPLEMVSPGELLQSLQKCVSAMEMQEKRETGEFHIPQPSAKAIWDEALEQARGAMCRDTIIRLQRDHEAMNVLRKRQCSVSPIIGLEGELFVAITNFVGRTARDPADAILLTVKSEPTP